MNPAIEPIGEPHKSFDEPLRAIWREVIAIAPLGSLRVSDTFWLELVCRLLAEVRLGIAGKGKQKLLKRQLAMIDLELIEGGSLMRKSSPTSRLM